jgi:hypothetical protein
MSRIICKPSWMRRFIDTFFKGFSPSFEIRNSIIKRKPRVDLLVFLIAIKANAELESDGYILPSSMEG